MSDDASNQKAHVARVFGQVAPGYDRFKTFAYCGPRLVELAQVEPGSAVLDVAAGTGAVLFPAAERVGPSGRVVGIDLAAPMVQATSAEIARRGLTNAEIRQMDAEHLEFPDATFDYVLCGFALFFFPDLQRALAEFRRVLRTGGRLAATTFRPTEGPMKRSVDVLRAHQVDVKLMAQPLQAPAELETALQQAHFADIRVVDEAVELVYADEEEWWSAIVGSAQGIALERLGAETRERLKQEVLSSVQPFKRADGLHTPHNVLYALATRPPD